MPKRPPHVEQLLAERANAAAYGDTTRVARIDERLVALGASVEREEAAVRRQAALAERQDPPVPPRRSTRPRETAGGE